MRAIIIRPGLSSLVRRGSHRPSPTRSPSTHSPVNEEPSARVHVPCPCGLPCWYSPRKESPSDHLANPEPCSCGQCVEQGERRRVAEGATDTEALAAAPCPVPTAQRRSPRTTLSTCPRHASRRPPTRHRTRRPRHRPPSLCRTACPRVTRVGALRRHRSLRCWRALSLSPLFSLSLACSLSLLPAPPAIHQCKRLPHRSWPCHSGAEGIWLKVRTAIAVD